MLNAIGLQNVGVERFIKEKLPFLARIQKTRIVVNIGGSSIDDFVAVAQRLSDHGPIDLLEANISCPNVKEGGHEFSATPEPAFRAIAAIVKASRFPVIAKLSPNTADVVAVARAVAEAGAAAISLINTLVGLAIDIDTRRPVLSNITGGLSGPAIKPVALAMTWQVARAVKLPIIGMGGIMTVEDAVQFFLAGATAIQIGTANFVDPTTSLSIVQGLEKYLRQEKISRITDLVGKLET
jgi:dihydroorotate dehydrogenase (NAD+) catalytic subunit